MVLLSTVSASASATVDFASGLTSTYDSYFVSITDLIPATDNTDLWLRVSQAAAFLVGATDYEWVRIQAGSVSALGKSESTGDTKIVVANALGSGTGETYSANIHFSNPAGAAKHKLFKWQSTYESAQPEIISATGSGLMNLNVTAIDGLRFLMSSGNITSGEFALYGVKKA